MSVLEDEKRLSQLRTAQFKLFNNDKKLVANNQNVELVLQGLDLNTTVPVTSFLKKHEEDCIGNSLLHLAFEKENVDLYITLLGKGPDFNTKDRKGNTVLHRAFYQFIRDYHSLNLNHQKSKLNEKFIASTLAAHIEHKKFDNPSDSNGLTHFHIACGIGNLEAVKFFLNHGVLVNQAVGFVGPEKFFGGYTPLHFATQFSHIKVVEILLEHGANANLENDKGQTPLHVSLERNIKMIDSEEHVSLAKDIEVNEKVINLLVDHNISPTFSHLFIVSAMKNSIKEGSVSSHGIDVNQVVSMESKVWPGYVALHFAAHVNVSTVKLLIKHGANCGAKDANGVTPFDMCAAQYEIEDLNEILCLIPNWKDIVMSDGKTKLVDLLLELEYFEDIKSFFLKAKDNVNLFVPFDSPVWPGFTVLHLLVLLTERKRCKTYYKQENGKAVFDPDFSVMEECLRQGANVTLKDHRSWTALHLAFKLNKSKTVDLLLKNHHRMKNCTDTDNLSHLHIACAVEHEELVKKFVWNYIDVNVVYAGDSPISCVYPGWTPLHIAVYKGNYEIAKLLVQFGADIYLPDIHGYTAVHQLMHHTSNMEISQALFNHVEHLRDFVHKDTGLSYLHVACATGNVDAAKRLLDLGADVNRIFTWIESDDKDYPRILSCKSHDGSTPLHFVSETTSEAENFDELLKLLIQRGADVLVRKSDGTSPLGRILKRGGEDEGMLLDVFSDALKNNVELQKRIEREIGMTILHVACRTVKISWMKELLKNESIDVNARIREDSSIWPRSTCLHVLMATEDTWCVNGERNVTKLLLERGADVTLMDGDGDTPVHVAYRKLRADQDDILTPNNVILLLKAHKNFELNPTSIEGISHLHIACHMLEADVVEQFLEHDFEVNSKTDAFCDSEIAACTPLLLAIKSTRLVLGIDMDPIECTPNPLPQLRIVDFLIKHGADVNVEDVLGNTPAHYVGSADNWSSSKMALLERLAKAGANVNARNVRGEAPLEMLLKCEKFSLEYVRYFVAFGCRFNAFNTVTEKGYIAIVDSLFEHREMRLLLFGIFTNSPDLMKADEMGRTAIHNVVSINDAESSPAQYCQLFDIFGQFGCDVDDQDNLGRTALHLAAQFRNESAVAGLLLAGADINITDRSGKTPFAYLFQPCCQCPISDKDKDHNQYSHSEVFKTFINQTKKMEFCAVFVNESNRVLLGKAVEKFDPSGIVNIGDILPEITQIADKKIKPYSLNPTNFVLLATAVIDYPTMSLAKRKAIDAFFQEHKKSFRKQYKQMAGIFQLQHRKAVLRRKIIYGARNSLRVLARCRFPDICSHIVLRSLKNFELQNLILSTVENDITKTQFRVLKD